MTAIAKRGTFTKADGRLIYGWALVCEERGDDGAWSKYVDTQGDHVPEEAMVEAALDFAKYSRAGKDMHGGPRVASVPMVYAITRDCEALGIQSSKTGMLIAWEPDDPALLEAVARGERTGFSIGGHVLEAEEDDAIGKFAKSADGAPVSKARVFRRFRIDEISLVDQPAMEGAVIGFVKRDSNSTPSATTEKVKPMDPEQMMARIAELEAALAAALSAKPEIEVEASADIPVIDPEKAGLAEVDMTPEQMMARIAELEAQLAEKSAPKAEDEMAKAADPVAYTCDDGTVLRKSAGDLVVKYAKAADEAARKLAHGELRKRALEALPALVGDEDIKVSLFKAAELIGPKAVEILKGANAITAEKGRAAGVSTEAPAPAVDASAEYEAAVTKAMADHKCSREQAAGIVLNTPAGAALYKRLASTK